MTRICCPYSVCVDGIPRDVEDVRPVHGKNNTASDHIIPLDPSDNDTNPMLYEAAEETYQQVARPTV